MFNWVIERLRVWGNELIEDGIVVRKAPGNLIDLKHGRTHYMLMGPIEDSSAPLVVLCHGASVFSFIWKRFAEQFLARGFRVLVFDFYGHGYTSVPDVKFTNELLREQLEELLERLGLLPQLIVPISSTNDKLPPFQEVNDQTPIEDIQQTPQKYRKTSHELYLVGHSMGGLIASEFAAKNKELVTKIILFNSAGLPVDLTITNYLPFAIHQLIRFMRNTQILDKPTHALGRLLQWVAKKMNIDYEDLCDHAFVLDEETHLRLEGTQIITIPQPPKRIRKRDRLYKVSQPFLPRYIHRIQKTTHSQLLSTLRFGRSLSFLIRTWLYQLTVEQRSSVLLSILKDFPLLDADHSKALLELENVPVLIFWGEEDGILPASLLNKFKKHVPHAVILKIPETDHAAFLQKPTSLFQMMLKFVQEDTLEELPPGKVENLQLNDGETITLIKP